MMVRSVKPTRVPEKSSQSAHVFHKNGCQLMLCLTLKYLVDMHQR